MNTPMPIRMCQGCDIVTAEASNQINKVYPNAIYPILLAQKPRQRGAAHYPVFICSRRPLPARQPHYPVFICDSALPRPLLRKTYCQRDMTRVDSLDCSKCESVEVLKKQTLTNMLVNDININDMTKIDELVRDYWNDPTSLFGPYVNSISLANPPYNIAPEILDDMKKIWNNIFGGLQGGKNGICVNPITKSKSHRLQTNPLGVSGLSLLSDNNEVYMLRKSEIPRSFLPLSYNNMIFDDNYGPAKATAKGYKNQYLFLRYMADKFLESGSQSNSIVLLNFPVIYITHKGEIIAPPQEIIAQRAKMIKCLLEKENILIIKFGYERPHTWLPPPHAMVLIIKPYSTGFIPPQGGSSITKIQITYFDPRGRLGGYNYYVMLYILELLSAFFPHIPQQDQKHVWNRWLKDLKWDFDVRAFRGDMRQDLISSNLTLMFTPYDDSALDVQMFMPKQIFDPGMCWLWCMCFIYIVIAFSDKSKDDLDGNIIVRKYLHKERDRRGDVVQLVQLKKKMNVFYIQFVLPFMQLYKLYMTGSRPATHSRFVPAQSTELQFMNTMRQYSSEYDRIIKDATIPFGSWSTAISRLISGEDPLAFYYFGPPILTLSMWPNMKDILDMCCCDISRWKTAIVCDDKWYKQKYTCAAGIYGQGQGHGFCGCPI